LEEPYEQQVVLDSKRRPRRPPRPQYANSIDQRHNSGAVGLGLGGGVAGGGDYDYGRAAGSNTVGASGLNAETLAVENARKRHATEMEAARAR